MKKICLAIAVLFLLSACSASNPEANSGFDGKTSAISPAISPAAEPAPAPEAVMDKAAYEYDLAGGAADDMLREEAGLGETANAVTAAQNTAAPPDISVTDPNRKLIYTANLSIETQSFEESTANVEAICASFQGFIESSSIDGMSITMRGKQYRAATYTLRIPSKFYKEFLNAAGVIGNITNKSQYSEDITDSYYDIESRLKILEMRRDRLFALLEKETSSKAIIEFETSLSETLYEIDSLTVTLKRYDTLVDYSTIHLYLSEVEELTEITEYKPAPQTIGERIKSEFGDSTQQISNFLVDVFVFIVGNILYVLIWVAIITACVIMYGTTRKRLRQRKQAKQETKENNEKGE